ncbi:putative ribonuclease H-like domain-containing protein [Tanacetum coccineum]
MLGARPCRLPHNLACMSLLQALETVSPDYSLATDCSVQECRAPRNKEGQFRNQDNTKKQGNNEDTSSKAMLAIDGVGFDWSHMAEEQVQTNMALMMFSDSEFEKVKQEKEGIKFKIKKFDKALKDLEKFLDEFKGYGSENSKQESNIVCDQKSDDSKENSDDSLVKEQVSKDTSSLVETSLNVDKETIFPVDKKVEFVKPKNHEKPVKKSVRYAEMYRSQTPRGNQRNWNGQKSNQLGSDFVMYNKACFICGSFNHVQAQCKYHQREMMVYGNNYNWVNYNYTTKRTHPNAQRNMVPRAVLMKTGLKPFNTARTVNTAHPKSTVFSAKPMSHFSKTAQSTVRRPFQTKTILSNKRFTHKVNTAKAQAVNTASPKTVNTARPKVVKTARLNSAVVNTVRVNQEKAVKALARWGKPQQDDKGFVDSGCSRHMTRNKAYLSDFKEFDGGSVTFGGGAHGGRISESLTCLVVKATSDESMLWHRRLGHINFKNINKFVKDNLVRGLPIKCFENDQTCVACLKGKQHRASCKSKVLNLITKPLFMLHMDLFGPTFVSSLLHKKYCLVITDDYSRFNWVFFLATKDETSELLKNFIKEIENLVDKKVKIIRCDNETEFKNKVMDDFYREKGIKREYSVARTPQQNGVAERRNRTLIEAARTMLADSKLPTTFWAEAVSTACYIQNRVLVVKPHNKTPYELFRGFKPALSFMKPFGCHVTILNTLDSLGKFDGKSDEGFFVGYSLSSKAFRVYNTRTRRVEENLHIGFLENKPMIEGNGPKWLFDIDSLTQSMNYVPVAAGTIINESAGTQGELNAGTSKEISQDCIVMPIWKDASYFDSPSKDVDNGEPKSAADDQKQVEDGPDNENDEKDKSDDDSSPKEVNTAGQHVNTASPEVNTVHFKLNTIGPLVNTASSYNQDNPKDMFTMGASHTLEATHVEFFSNEDEPEVDLGNITNSYTVLTTPNTRIHKDHPIENVIGDIEPTSITKTLSDSSWVEAMQEELLQFKLQQSAFLYRTIEEEVYVTQPPGFKDLDHPDKVYKVVKALYGLHQAPRAWYETLANYLLGNGFKRGKIDQTLFIKKQKGDILLVQVYVDDIIFGSTNKDLCTGFEKLMKDKFQMIDLEKPLDKDGDADDVDIHLYRYMIGSLMYLTTSRPDFMFAVCACARFQVTPKTSHLLAVKRIFRYLKGKLTLGLWYSRDSPFELVAYTDSDYAGATQDRKSTTGGCQFLGNRLISWQCFVKEAKTVVATSI